jgi:hypothetical protein
MRPFFIEGIGRRRRLTAVALVELIAFALDNMMELVLLARADSCGHRLSVHT